LHHIWSKRKVEIKEELLLVPAVDRDFCIRAKFPEQQMILADQANEAFFKKELFREAGNRSSSFSLDCETLPELRLWLLLLPRGSRQE
jgi:hypothetical protein